jgi:hypothetical protein
VTLETKRPDQNPPRQEFDFHWEQTQQHTSEISDLKQSVGRLEVGVSSLGNNVRDGFADIQASLKERTQPPPPTPWIPVAGLIISTIVVLGTILAFTFGLITDNMQRENDLRFDHVIGELEKSEVLRENDNRRVTELAIKIGDD